MRRMLIAVVAMLFCLACKQPNTEIHVLQGEALGTTYQVKFYGDHFDAGAKFDSVINAINNTFSTYWPNSKITRINHGDTTVVVDAMFDEVYGLAGAVYASSEGFYDPTVGTLVNAYGFGPEGQINKLDDHVIDSLMQYVGFDKISLDDNGYIHKENPNVYLDFNSIAKGYCIDRVGAMLEQNGVENYLIELGGELLAKGKNLSKNKSWAVGIENIEAPVDDRGYTKVVVLKNRGMAGSGNYRKFRVDEATGERYVHTINPLTGQAHKSDVLSATVIANTCAEADAYATTFMAMGLKRSQQLLEKLDTVDAYLMYNEGSEIKVYMSKGFDKYLRD